MADVDKAIREIKSMKMKGVSARPILRQRFTEKEKAQIRKAREQLRELRRKKNESEKTN